MKGNDGFWWQFSLFNLVSGIGPGVILGLLIGYFIFGGAP